MKSLQFIIILLAALIISVGAIVLYNQKNVVEPEKAEQQTFTGQMLFAELKQKVSDLAKIEIMQNDDSISLVKDNQKTWILESPYGYPADQKKMNNLIVEITDISIGDRLTDNPEKYDNFGLKGDIGSFGAIVMKDDQDKEIMRLIAGDERKAPPDPKRIMPPIGRYYRIGNDPGVYLADANLYWLNTRITTWVESRILTFPMTNVMSVSIDHGSTESLSITWEGGTPVLKALDDGMETKTSEINTVRGGLSNLYMKDVLAADSDKAKALVFDTTFTAYLKDGSIYHAKTAAEGEQYYIALSAEYGEPIVSAEDKATTDSMIAIEKAAGEAKKAVPEFNKRHTPWVYEVMDWPYKNLSRKRSDLMQPEGTEASREEPKFEIPNE